MHPELLKIVALSLAAITLIGALALCRLELRRRSQTHARLQTILSLMTVTLVLVLGSASLEVLKRNQADEAQKARVSAAEAAVRASYQRRLDVMTTTAVSDLNRQQTATHSELEELKAQNAALKDGRSVAVREAAATLGQLEQGKERLSSSVAADPTLRSELAWQLSYVCKQLQKIRSSLGDPGDKGRCAALLLEAAP